MTPLKNAWVFQRHPRQRRHGAGATVSLVTTCGEHPPGRRSVIQRHASVIPARRLTLDDAGITLRVKTGKRRKSFVDNDLPGRHDADDADDAESRPHSKSGPRGGASPSRNGEATP